MCDCCWWLCGRFNASQKSRAFCVVIVGGALHMHATGHIFMTHAGRCCFGSTCAAVSSPHGQHSIVHRRAQINVLNNRRWINWQLQHVQQARHTDVRAACAGRHCNPLSSHGFFNLPASTHKHCDFSTYQVRCRQGLQGDVLRPTSCSVPTCRCAELGSWRASPNYLGAAAQGCH